MTPVTKAFLGIAVLAITACNPSTQAGLTAGQGGAMPNAQVTRAQAADWRVADIVVDVPAALVVSEDNTIKPRADIVWREDPLGDRHAQVAAIMDAALQTALNPLSRGNTPVVVELEMTRFHALTERTRYSIRHGGEHEIEFIFTVRHAGTGEVLSGPRHVDITFPAYGGEDAIEAERNGIFQRDRINARVIEWAQAEFGLAGEAEG